MSPCSIVTVCAIVLAGSALSAQQLAFNDVKTRFSRSLNDRRLVDKDADLVLDSSARRLIVRSPDRPLDVSYDDIQKIVFDVSTHMRGGAMAALVGGLAGAAVAARHVNDYWFYLEYRGSDGTPGSYVLEVSRESSPKLIAEAKAIFGDKVSVAEFPEKEADIEKSSLKDLQSKHDLTIDKRTHPLPDLRADRALVVVVCPPLAARFAGKGNQYKLHANNEVIAVNKMGTYSFAYLEPGEYRLVSQAENASGFAMALEAGKAYYFLQDTFSGMWKSRTKLSRHSRELVMHELSGAHHAIWKRK